MTNPVTAANPIVTTFDVFVDYDLDAFKNDGCHGTDIFLDDGPLVLRFTQVNNDTYSVQDATYEPVLNYPIVLKSDNNLYFQPGDDDALQPIQSTIHILGLEIYQGLENEPKGRTKLLYSITPDFAECAKDSKNLNTDLTPAQQAIVERFFTAAAQLHEAE